MTTDHGGGEALPPRLIFLLNVAQRRVQAAIADEGEGTTAARAGLLLALRPDGSATPMKTLGALMDLGPSSLSGLLDRMARDGLIARHPDPVDKRAWDVALTEAGQRARIEAGQKARALNDRLCAGFTPAELTVISQWLGSVIRTFPKELTK